MSESTTGVAVTPPSGGPINHPAGTTIRVDAAGHLHVVRDSADGADNIAIYAPGRWVHATVGAGK